MSFPRSVLDDWDRTDEIDVETSAGPGKRVHKTTIWIVVDGNEAYVRSVRGPEGRWYRELTGNPSGAIWVGDQRTAVRAEPAPEAIERVTAALERKYRSRWSGPTDSMVRAEVLSTTLRLVPE